MATSNVVLPAEAPVTAKSAKEWKKWRDEKRTFKRKYREEKLIQKLVKKKEADEEEAAKKLRNDQEEEKFRKQGRHYTVSLALPGSILDNAQSPELRTYLAGQIARAAVVFSVDEIVIFDETDSKAKTTEGEFAGVGKKGDANIQMARILQYLECPQYLRKSFFPRHSDLKFAGLLNPLDCPHHMRAEDKCPYRDGVVTSKPTKPGRGSYVNVGQLSEVEIDKVLQAGLRVTVKINLDEPNPGKKGRGRVVAPSAPRTEAGIYWGYSVRLAGSLGTAITEAPYSGGYDCLLGTSERGQSVDDLALPSFRHLLVVFGGLQGLEASLDADQDLHIDDPTQLFPYYVNVCPGQGSRTIRTEEAILIAMSSLRPKIIASGARE